MDLVFAKLGAMNLKTFISAERGRATKLARHLGVSTSYLSQMASQNSPISPERSLAIELFSEGLVPRRETLPERWQNIWPELTLTILKEDHHKSDRENA